MLEAPRYVLPAYLLYRGKIKASLTHTPVLSVLLDGSEGQGDHSEHYSPLVDANGVYKSFKVHPVCKHRGVQGDN